MERPVSMDLLARRAAHCVTHHACDCHNFAADVLDEVPGESPHPPEPEPVTEQPEPALSRSPRYVRDDDELSVRTREKWLRGVKK